MGKRTNTAKWMANQNRWQIKVQKGGERRTFTSATPGRTGQREANAKADAWLDDGIKGGKTKVSAIWDDYIEDVRLSTGTSNYIQAKNNGKNYILPVCGNIKIENLSEGHLQSVLNKAYKKGCLRADYKGQERKEPLSKKTLQGILHTEKNFVKWCRQRKYTNLNPEFLAVPAGARLKGKKILSPNALKVLFSVDTRIVRGKEVFDDLIYTYRFIVSSGLRPGEVEGLWVGNIKGRQVDISHAINQYGEETKGKNKNAVRSFEMNDYSYDAVQKQLALLRSYGIKLNYTTPLFHSGGTKALYNRWISYQKSNKIFPLVSLYELRHTFVSLAQDLPDGQLKMLVGHSKSMDTRGIYAHELEGMKKEIAANTTELLKKHIG